MNDEHPAMLAAQNSWRCVQAKDKEGWLALMAEDVCIEDPIGTAPTNPTGKGLCGKAEVAEFYDKNIEPNKMKIETLDSYVAHMESAHVLRLTTEFPNGVKATVQGIFTYKLNDEGKLKSLRGYWHMGAMQIEQPS